MTVKKLKEVLNSLPPECDDYDVIFGECAWGEKVKKLQKLGKKIALSFF